MSPLRHAPSTPESTAPVTHPVGPHLTLDSRGALLHRTERWLAVADLHFGYEVTMRQAGNLMPIWGMDSIEQRLLGLLRDHAPRTLILLGDSVHDRAGREVFGAFLKELHAEVPEVVLVSGNHDRRCLNHLGARPQHETAGWRFIHGDCWPEANEELTMPAGLGSRQLLCGHFHPAATLRDGAGTRIKLPALVNRGSLWILPAFSPWSSGTGWARLDGDRLWLCHRRHIFPLL